MLCGFGLLDVAVVVVLHDVEAFVEHTPDVVFFGKRAKRGADKVFVWVDGADIVGHLLVPLDDVGVERRFWLAVGWDVVDLVP